MTHMTSPMPIDPHTAHEAATPATNLEEDVSEAAVAASGALSATKLAAVLLIGFLVWPPLAVIAFTIVVPLLVVALIVGLLVAVLSTPYLLFHHFRRHDEGHLSLLAHRLRLAARALFDLAPHRIVADIRRVGSGR